VSFVHVSPGRLGRLITLTVAALALTAAPSNAAQFQSIHAGLDHTCAVKSDGTAWCWGNGITGQLGLISVTRARTPRLVIGSYSTVAISSGASYWCELLAKKAVLCTGANARGQLGDGSTGAAQFPQDVLGLNAATAVRAGKTTTCAINAGSVWCWGDGTRGQLGDGNLNDGPITAPVQVQSVANIVDASVGDSHVCAVRNDGIVLCWGDSANGKLGNDLGSPITFPTPVTGLNGVKAVALGDRHSCALKTDGTVWCWGDNALGQLGIGAPSEGTNHAAQVPGLTGVTQIASESATTCAVKSDGTAWCWGDGAMGQLGNGTKTTAYAPTQVVGITDAAQITVSSGHGCLVTKSQVPYCWGSNQFGQLGNGGPLGASGTALTPQAVVDFLLGHATYLPADITGVPKGSTAGGVIQFRELKISRRSGKKCPKTVTLEISAKGKKNRQKATVTTVKGACLVGGRYLLPSKTAKATKAKYTLSSSSTKTASRTLTVRRK
jgi:alpha-tubulin suppressor-like RCC1 family protein